MFETKSDIANGTISILYGSNTQFNQNSRQTLTFEDAQRLKETLATFDFEEAIKARNHVRQFKINEKTFEAEKTQRMSNARLEGYECYWKGNGMDANPYDLSDVERAEWQIGWDKAREIVASNNE
jgi:ribosome modulation factor